jgi:hypothetical protein
MSTVSWDGAADKATTLQVGRQRNLSLIPDNDKRLLFKKLQFGSKGLSPIGAKV